jgi:hypothetical protein
MVHQLEMHNTKQERSQKGGSKCFQVHYVNKTEKKNNPKAKDQVCSLAI